MLTLFDMLEKAQNGEAMRQMADQFALSQKQAQDAMVALMPAFSTGLKRNASDPMGVANFLQALSSGQHAQYYDNMAKAFSPQGVAEGNGILGHLFGSKEVSRAIAAQAAQATGVGQEIFKQMMPAIAAAMMGGLYKQSTGQLNAAQANPYGEMGTNMLGQMMEQMTAWQSAMNPAAAKSEPRNANPLDNPFGQVLEQMFGGKASDDDAKPRPNPMNPMGLDNPFGRIFEDMMKGGFGQMPPAPPEPDPEPEPAKKRDPYGELFGEMFEAGRKTQESYQKSMESVFDQYLEGMKKHR